MNHWIATNTTGSYCLKNHQTCSKYIIFTLHARNVRLQYIPRSQILTNWNDSSRTSEQSKSRCLSNVRLGRSAVVYLHSCWWQAFEAYDIKMMWFTICFTIFETITASSVCINDSWNVHVSTALTAQSVTSNCRWSGHFLQVCWVFLPGQAYKFSYLTDTEQKMSVHFFRDMVYNMQHTQHWCKQVNRTLTRQCNTH